MSEDLAPFLEPAWFVDSDHPDVVAYARAAAGDAVGDVERAARVFEAVRDGLRYDPYVVSNTPEDYKSSAILKQDRGYCTPKAILFAASLRALGIPAKLGFADVKNHLTSEKLRRSMGTDIFAYHGYVEVRTAGRWVKVTPAFNKELCERFGVPPLEFDGVNEALLQAADGEGRRFMEYVRDHGTFADLPFAAMMKAFLEIYDSERPTPDVEDEAFRG